MAIDPISAALIIEGIKLTAQLISSAAKQLELTASNLEALYAAESEQFEANRPENLPEAVVGDSE